MSQEARRFSIKCRRLKGQVWDLSGRLVVVLGEGAQRWGCPEEPGAGFVRCLALHDADGDCEGGDVCLAVRRPLEDEREDRMKGLKAGDVLAPKKGHDALFLALGSERRDHGLDDMWELLVICDDPAFDADFSAPMRLGLRFKAQAWWVGEHLRRWGGS